jgi:hypothetical protein
VDLYSCRCGVVLNRSVMDFPSDSEIREADGSIKEDRAVWLAYPVLDYVPAAKCPACGATVPKVGDI